MNNPIISNHFSKYNTNRHIAVKAQLFLDFYFEACSGTGPAISNRSTSVSGSDPGWMSWEHLGKKYSWLEESPLSANATEVLLSKTLHPPLLNVQQKSTAAFNVCVTSPPLYGHEPERC